MIINNVDNQRKACFVMFRADLNIIVTSVNSANSVGDVSTTTFDVSKHTFKQTFVEFSREKGIIFDKSASNVQNLNSVKELLLLERFYKSSVGMNSHIPE